MRGLKRPDSEADFFCIKFPFTGVTPSKGVRIQRVGVDVTFRSDYDNVTFGPPQDSPANQRWRRGPFGPQDGLLEVDFKVAIGWSNLGSN
jgi:hypothetical protein